MSEKKAGNRLNNTFRYLVKALRHLVLHNGWLKLIAIVISLVLWAGLISQDESLTREKVFQDVNVSIVGTDALKESGFIVTSDLEELLKSITVTAAVPQKQFESAEASAYNLRIDLSKLSSTGTQELKILSTASALYGKVVSTRPETIPVDVEVYKSRPKIPISVTNENGKNPGGWYEGWYMSSPTIDLDRYVAVRGPQSLVDEISHARVIFDPDSIEWIEGTFVTLEKIGLYKKDEESNTYVRVDSPLLTIYSDNLVVDSAVIESTLLPVMSFDTAGMIEAIGEVAPGYEVKEVKITPEIVRIAARQEVLEQLDELPVEHTVNVTDMSETKKFQLTVLKPSEDAVLDNETLTVTVIIEPVKDDE